ncbi:MAG: hypothetical protein H6607_03255 [Flavobacteriales bacterium]|nr:hypothetical protein [Flavobacteriales bacterium]
MINESEIASLIYLLDDTDDEIVVQIESKILSFGHQAIPYLEQASFDEAEIIRLERLQNLIKELKRDGIINQLKDWKQNYSDDLLKALLIIEQIEFARVDTQGIKNQLDKIRLDAWLEFKYDLTSFEQIKVMNYVFFNVHKFKGNADNYHHVHNSYLSKVLENRTGNPVSLGIVYSLIAQRINIPVYGVNLPQHFVLGYKNQEGVEILKRFNDESSLSFDENDEVMFYINPFSDGLILNADSIRSFLKQLQLESKPEYFSICSNIEIIKRVLRNLTFSYGKTKETKKMELVKLLLEVL